MTAAGKTWTREEARALIEEIVVELAPAPHLALTDARLIEDLGYHSLTLLELAFSLEDEFDLPTLDEAVARQILTVGDIEQHVTETLQIP
jgi:acyl carrier protein